MPEYLSRFVYGIPSMGFDYRFHYTSYNSLIVPLDIGTWECELLLGHEYRERKWRRNSDGKGDKDACQLEKDSRAFDLYFRPNYNIHSVSGQAALREIQSFLRHHLSVARSKLPTDNAGIERVLRQAVRDGALMPVVNRDYPAPPRTFRPAPAPLHWQPSGGGGNFLQSGYLLPPSAHAAQLPALRGESSRGGGGILDRATVADVTLDSAASAGEDAAMDGGGGTLTPLGDVQQYAGVFLSPAEEVECEMQLNADMDECSVWYAVRPSSWGMCRERATQRYANCLRGLG